jgi:hypothetical protein
MHTDQARMLLPECLHEQFGTMYVESGYFEKPSAFRKMRPITQEEKNTMHDKFANEIELIRAREGMKSLLEAQ